MTEDHTPHVVDVHIGRRIRVLRRERRLSQTALAEACGVTYQQIQKYENGANRVSGSSLWEVAKTLGVNIARFYDGLPQPNEIEHPGERAVREYTNTPGCQMLIHAAMELPPKLVATFAMAMQDTAEVLHPAPNAKRKRAA